MTAADRTDATETGQLDDLCDRSDVERLLRRFYGQVLVDDLLAEPFEGVRAKGLDAHLPVMCDFWETVLWRGGKYRGPAHVAHERVYGVHPFGAEHFIRWLTLWENTVDEMYAGPRAEHAKLQAYRVAWALHRRLTGSDSPLLNEALAKRPGTRFSAKPVV